MSSFNKWLTIVGILAFTFGYSVYQRSKHKDFFRQSRAELILESFPTIAGQGVYNQALITKESLFSSGPKGVVVHFWGTWCAPCEAEFPELMELTQKLSGNDVIFVLMAVNDEVKKIKKFLKRFKNPSNKIIFAIDNSGKSMENFGTNKVPETFVFDAKGKHVKKYVGPQEWRNDNFFNTIYNLLLKP